MQKGKKAKISKAKNAENIKILRMIKMLKMLKMLKLLKIQKENKLAYPHTPGGGDSKCLNRLPFVIAIKLFDFSLTSKENIFAKYKV